MHAKKEPSQTLNIIRIMNHPRHHELTRILELTTQKSAQQEMVSANQVKTVDMNLTALA
jgi:hypothetical protein